MMDWYFLPSFGHRHWLQRSSCALTEQTPILSSHFVDNSESSHVSKYIFFARQLLCVPWAMGYTRSLTVSFLCYSVVILPAESGTCFTSRFIKRMWGPNSCCSEREMIMSQSIGIPLGRGRMWSRSWLTVPSSLRWIVKNGTSQAKHIAAPSCEISEEVSQGSLGYLCAQRKARRREIPNRQTVKLSNGSI